MTAVYLRNLPGSMGSAKLARPRKSSNLRSSGLPVRRTNQLRIEPATAQLGPRLSPAIKGAIKLRYVLTNRVTMRINIMRRG